MGKLDGTVVLITGAAGGIGAATARRLVRRGARVVLVDLDDAAVAALAAELGPGALAVAADVRELAPLEDAVAQGIAHFGGLDVVLANAGVGTFASVLTIDPQDFRRIIDINITGVFHTVRAALPALIERRGHVLVVSSLAAYASGPGIAAYGASKAGVEHFAHALRAEVAHHGVTVGTAHMSWIDTPMVREGQRQVRSFDRMLEQLPRPLSTITSVDTCADAFVAGIAARRRHVDVPRWVGLLRWLKPLLHTAPVQRRAAEHAAELVAEMERESDVASPTGG